MSIRLLVCFSALLLSAASASPLQLKPRFDRTGVYDPNAKSTPIVTGPDQVKVYYATSPPGFTLRENELAVEPGFTHEILGTVSVFHQDGECEDGHATKAHVVRALQQAAFENGGNAVIYARSELPDAQPEPGDRCGPIVDGEPYGTGWAVVLRDPPPAPAEAPPAASVAP